MSNFKYCPKHPYEKMSLLLTSYVCDVCDPPKNSSVNKSSTEFNWQTTGNITVNNNPRWWRTLDQVVLSQPQFSGNTFKPNVSNVVALGGGDDPLLSNVVMVVLIDVFQYFSVAGSNNSYSPTRAVAVYNWPNISGPGCIVDIIDNDLWKDLIAESHQTLSPLSRHWRDHHESEMLGVEAYGNILGTILCKLV